MNNIYLHIGLHKTGTKYLQHYVFPFLDRSKFVYNPERLTQYLMDYLKADHEDQTFVLNNFMVEKQRVLKENLNKKILISKEIMSGDLFSGYEHWEDGVNHLFRLFPEAHIIMCLRFQPDWLVSCYRESIHEHHYQSIENFMNYNKANDIFKRPLISKNKNGFANLYALNLDYHRMLKIVFSLFARKKVLNLFFEDFKLNQHDYVAKILNFIGSGNVIIKPLDTIPNRGYSAKSIEISLERFKNHTENNTLSKVHRPIFFFGPKSIPAGNINLSILDKDKYWGPQFLRDNEEVRSPNYPKLSIEEKKEYENSWRYKVKQIYDKENYIDWDLLGDLRQKLENKYTNINCNLLKYFSRTEIPSKYLSKDENTTK
jgi:hypothetical protein